MVNDYHKPHEKPRGDSKVDGPYLTDSDAARDEEYRRRREAQINGTFEDSSDSTDDKEEETFSKEEEVTEEVNDDE